MRLSRLLPAVPALLLALAPALRADDTKEFLDPANWEGLSENWKVEGTSVTGHTDKDLGFNTFLCSKKKYSDFELSFKARLVGGKGNSGVQIRSAVIDPKKHVVAGPQADMATHYWGSLFGEKVGGMIKAPPPGFEKKHARPTGVNDYRIVVKGNHITIQVNGATSVDGDFPTTPNKKPLAPEGIIAFQLHQGGPMTVEFTEIKFTDLGKK